jgi:hypothetical protein
VTYAALLADTCSVVRRSGGTWNDTTGTYGPGTDTALYAGPCRVDSISGAMGGAGRIRIGEEAVIQSGYWVFLPPEVIAPKPEDVVIVTASEDGNMVGRELIVKKNDANFSPNTANAMRALLCDDVQEGP